MANETKYFKTPFAESGTRTEVPNSSVGGAVGFDTGFGSDYELPQGSAGRKRIERDKYNGLHHSITKNLKQWQEKVYPTWIEDGGAGVPFSYPQGMIVNHSGENWVSNETANQEEPGTGVKWKIYAPVTALQELSGLTDPSDLDGVYRRVTTVAAVEAGNYKVGDKLTLSDRAGANFDVVAGGTSNGFDILDAANGNTAVYTHVGPVMLEHLGYSSGNAHTILNRINDMASDRIKIELGESLNYVGTGDAVLSKDVEIIGNGSTIEFTSGFLLAEGSATDLTTISIDADKGVSAITAASTASISDDDTLIIWNPNDFSFSSHRFQYRDGEFNEVNSVSGSVINLKNPTRSSYLASASVKIIKVTPIKFSAKNLTIKGNSSTTDALKLRLCKDVVLDDVVAKNAREDGLRLDRCYGVSITGGYYECRNPAIDTQYGIFLGNSQKVSVTMSKIHGTRHGFATGGQNDLGSVPCRDVYVSKTEGSSDLFWSIDAHGNTQNMVVEDCTSSRGVGMGGVDFKVIRGTHRRTDEAPIQFGEVVGGVYQVEGVDLITDAIAPIRPNNSALLEAVNGNIEFIFRDIDVYGSGICEGLALISFGWDTGSNWAVTAENIGFYGFTPVNVLSLNKLVRGDAASVPFPRAVTLKNVKGLDNTAKYCNLTGVWTGALTKFYMPAFNSKTDVSILSGEFQSSEVSLNFPIYPTIPCIGLAARGPAFANTIATFPIPSTEAAGALGVRLITANSANTAGANQTRKVNINVTCEGLTL